MPRATLHEEFTHTFDVFPTQPPATQSTLRPATQASTFAAGVNGFEYGFGSATRRFQSEVYPQHLLYGMANKAVVELDRTPPVNVMRMGDAAPSVMLPEFAARFEPEPGRAFSYGPDRKHPPGPDGQELFWVQAKDNQAPMDNNDPPDLFAVSAPVGAGPIEAMHEQPLELMSPAARREALVFEKCQQRARLELRKTTNDACRMARISKQFYPNGIMGVEGPLIEQSLVYENLRDATLAEQARREDHARRRFENLRSKRDSQLPYKLLTHDSHSTTHDRIFQRKLEVTAKPQVSQRHFEMRPATTTHLGGHRTNQEKPLRAGNPGRAQRLHDVNACGRAYDIISGIRTPVAPSQPDRRPLDDPTFDRRLHPSNMSLPRRSGTAPTLIGPIPDAHTSSWKPTSPTRAPSKRFLE